MDGLAGDAEFAGDVGLGEAFPDQGADQVAALGGELLGQAVVLQGLGPDFLEVPEFLGVGRRVWVGAHVLIMTTPGCHVNP